MKDKTLLVPWWGNLNVLAAPENDSYKRETAWAKQNKKTLNKFYTLFKCINWKQNLYIMESFHVTE